MRKLMMLAAMLAMVLLVSATAMAQEANASIFLTSSATLNQVGDQTAVNVAVQEQFAPGGDATGGDVTIRQFGFDDDNGGGDGGGGGGGGGGAEAGA